MAAGVPPFLEGGGISGEVARAVAWEKTPLGPPASWPTSLKTTVGIILHSRHPMFLFWGADLVQLYNDGYLPSFGHGKHPKAMGQRGRECWEEIWHIIGPQINDVMTLAKPSWNIDALVPILRNGRLEDVFWSYGYSPVHVEDGSVGGVLVVCTETTERVLLERRLERLRALTNALAMTDDASEMGRITLRVLGADNGDIPFLGLEARSRPVGLVPGEQTYVADVGDDESLVFGLNPRLPFDAAYEGHLLEIAAALTNTRARARVAGERERLLVEADAASRAKDEFLAMLGHELRNPLAPIMTALQLMALREGDEASRERTIIERQARHLVHLVDDLLDVSRVAQGKVELKKVRVRLAEIVDRAVEMAHSLFEQKAHVLEVEVAPDLVVDADSTRLSQVVSNLLTNAARYTPPGGVVRVRGAREDDAVVLRIVDNGNGIDHALLPHLFERFFQGPRGSDRAQGGLGLGLALVKSLVELHGGTVAAASEGPGRGSTFTVRMPLPSTPAAVGSEPRSVAKPTTHAGVRVLMVDDNEEITELFAAYLEGSGIEVRTAHDGPSALAVVASFAPTVAILDIGLPVMDGYELADLLRARMGDLTPRLIAMSGYGRADDRENSRRAGFERHFVKPVDARALLAAIVDVPQS